MQKPDIHAAANAKSWNVSLFQTAKNKRKSDVDDEMAKKERELAQCEQKIAALDHTRYFVQLLNYSKDTKRCMPMRVISTVGRKRRRP